MRATSMGNSTRLVTAAELERFPEDDCRYELVEGRVVRMTPVGFQHGRLVARLLFLLGQHLEQHDTGVVVTEVGFKLASNPDTVRAPDLAFVRRERLPSADPRGFWNGPPDLAVEVLSPWEGGSDIREKVDAYLAYGVPLVVVIEPADRSIGIRRRLSTRTIRLEADADVLDLSDVVPGFTCRLDDIFEARRSSSGS